MSTQCILQTNSSAPVPWTYRQGWYGQRDLCLVTQTWLIPSSSCPLAYFNVSSRPATPAGRCRKRETLPNPPKTQKSWRIHRQRNMLDCRAQASRIIISGKHSLWRDKASCALGPLNEPRGPAERCWCFTYSVVAETRGSSIKPTGTPGLYNVSGTQGEMGVLIIHNGRLGWMASAWRKGHIQYIYIYIWVASNNRLSGSMMGASWKNSETWEPVDSRRHARVHSQLGTMHSMSNLMQSWTLFMYRRQEHHYIYVLMLWLEVRNILYCTTLTPMKPVWVI